MADTQYNDAAAAPVDPYSDAYNAPPPQSAGAPMDTRERDPLPPRDRSRSRSPVRGSGGYRSPPPSYGSRRRSPAPSRPKNAPPNPTPSKVLGVFGLSVRTTERELEDEFNRFGRVENVTIVYDQRSDRSRGFGFIKMSTVEEAQRCIQELNGIDLNGRRIRVDFSVTERAHAPTPGEYMGHRRSAAGGLRDSRRAPYDIRDRDRDRDFRDRDREYRRDYDRYDRDRYDRYDRDRGERDRDPYGRDNRDWRDRRSPPPRRYSPERKRRSYSRSPPRGSGSSPVRSAREFERPPPSSGMNGDHRW